MALDFAQLTDLLARVAALGIDLNDLVTILEQAKDADEELKVGFTFDGLIDGRGSFPPVPLRTPLENAAAHIILDIIDKIDTTPGDDIAQVTVKSKVKIFSFINGSERVDFSLRVRPRESAVAPAPTPAPVG